MDDSIMKRFVDQIDEIDALAQFWPGFVSQPTPPDDGSIYKGNTLVKVSIWESVENLHDITYRSQHAEALNNREKWFLRSDRSNYVLYSAPVGVVLTDKEIHQRFEYLQKNGSTPHTFSFERPFTVDDMLNYDHKVGRYVYANP